VSVPADLRGPVCVPACHIGGLSDMLDDQGPGTLGMRSDIDLSSEVGCLAE